MNQNNTNPYWNQPAQIFSKDHYTKTCQTLLIIENKGERYIPTATSLWCVSIKQLSSNLFCLDFI